MPKEKQSQTQKSILWLPPSLGLAFKYLKDAQWIGSIN